MFRTAVVGVDERPSGSDAIALAKNLLAKDGSLALANVHRGDPNTRAVSPEYAAGERERARELLEAARSEAASTLRSCGSDRRRWAVVCTRSRSATAPICWSWGHTVAACSGG